MNLDEMAKEIETQDVASTSHPIYVVQQCRSLRGVHPDITDSGDVNLWEYVQPFFTLKGAERYIEDNRHNLRQPRVYIYSAYRNYEWQAIRKMLLSLNKEKS